MIFSINPSSREPATSLNLAPTCTCGVAHKTDAEMSLLGSRINSPLGVPLARPVELHEWDVKKSRICASEKSAHMRGSFDLCFNGLPIKKNTPTRAQLHQPFYPGFICRFFDRITRNTLQSSSSTNTLA